MPDLTIQVQEIKGLPGTALVILSGSIDANTVITFQTHLNTVRERGITRFILDMESVKYVNSTGLGYLINLSDSVSGGKGCISLVKVQPKVKVVFDMLGLNAFFKIYPTRDEALKNLTQEPIASPSEQTVILKTQTLAQASTGGTSVRAQPPAHAAPVAAEAAGEQVPVECQSCKVLLAVREVGTYKCPRCFTLFNYVGGGKASFLPRRKVVPVQLSLNFSEECTGGLLEFVKITARRAGFVDGTLSDLLNAVKDTVSTIRRYAYGNDENNIYHVMLVAVDSEIELRFADYGLSLSANKTDETGRNLFQGVKEAMDKFELKNHPRGGNVLTLAKKAR
ncbi:MAG: anti-sigma factor antagonist [Planctomycetes bacterium]|nr:anti-sigma factor antagonist [Planctomycetota bacterium]